MRLKQIPRIVQLFGSLSAIVGLTPTLAQASVRLYTDCGFGGTMVELGAGSYTLTQLAALGIPNDSLSAIEVDSGNTLTIYQHGSFTGFEATYSNESVSCLSNSSRGRTSGDWDNDASSAVITGPGPSTTSQSTYGNSGNAWSVGSSGATRIQAENFDTGGEDIAYNDTTSGNAGGAYRTSENVDVQTTGDSDGAYNVGWIVSGEWLEYTVNIASSGDHTLRLRTAGTATGQLRVSFNGTDKTGAITTPNTGNWQSYTTTTKTVSLSSGTQVVRVAFEGGKINLNWIELEKVATTTTSQTTFGNGGSAWSVASSGARRIEAENFDTGGQGVAYNDTDVANTGGAYRTSERVDIQTTTDSGGGYNVGWINSGEWLEYTINVASSGDHSLRIRSAGTATGQVRVSFNGSDKTGAITTPNTGNWQSFSTTTKTVSLSSGTQVVRVAFEGGKINLNWIELEKGGTVVTPPTTGTLDPSKLPYQNFDLSNWKITLPDGNDYSVSWVNSSSGKSANEFYTNTSDGGMVFQVGSVPKPGSSTSYNRSELREMLDSSADDTSISKNNWVISTSSSTNRNASGAVDGYMAASLKVNRVSTSGSDSSMIGRVIVGQIHGPENEPCRLYYRKLPGNTNGSIYFAHEKSAASGGGETYYELIGTRSSSQSNPSNGPALNEEWQYEIYTQGDNLYVTVWVDGVAYKTSSPVNMSTYRDKYLYFKAGAYNQNRESTESDYARVTFYELDVTH